MHIKYSSRLTVLVASMTLLAQQDIKGDIEMAYEIVRGVHVGGIYSHRNGKQYKVLNVACNVEDLSWEVVYEALYKNDVSQIWCRKLEDFLATITLESGEKQPRFVYQG